MELFIFQPAREGEMNVRFGVEARGDIVPINLGLGRDISMRLLNVSDESKAYKWIK